MIYHTNPLKADTDGDGLTDGQEVLKYHTNPLVKDTDHDGLTDYQEVMIYHTNPLLKDSDHDGLTDYQEIMVYHTNPLKADTDEDGVIDSLDAAPLGNLMLETTVALQQIYNIPIQYINNLKVAIGAPGSVTVQPLNQKTVTYVYDLDDQKPYAVIDVMVFFKANGVTNVVDVNPVFGARTLRFYVKPVLETVKMSNVTMTKAVELQVFWDKEGKLVPMGSVKLPILRNATSTVTIPLKMDLFAGNVAPMESGAYVASITVGFKLLVAPTK
jgi:hypothetical protein